MLEQNGSCAECLYLCAFTRTRLLWGSASEHLPSSLKKAPGGAEVREWLFTDLGFSEQISLPPQRWAAAAYPAPATAAWCPLQGRPRCGTGTGALNQATRTSTAQLACNCFYPRFYRLFTSLLFSKICFETSQKLHGSSPAEAFHLCLKNKDQCFALPKIHSYFSPPPPHINILYINNLFSFAAFNYPQCHSHEHTFLRHPLLYLEPPTVK